MGRGESAAEIARAIGRQDIERTIGRRMREIRGDVGRSGHEKLSGPIYVAPVPPPALIIPAASVPTPASSSSGDGEPPKPPPDPPSDDFDPLEPLPENARAEIAARWLKRVERAAIKAEAEGQIGALGTMGRLIATFLEHQRKAQPIKLPDPNEMPDVIAAAGRAREMLHMLIDTAVGS